MIAKKWGVPFLVLMLVGGAVAEEKDRNLKLEGGYKADFLRVTAGGLAKGGKPMGHLDLKLSADLEKIYGWSGTSAFINFLHDHGDTVNAKHVGSLLGVSNIEVPDDTYRYFQAWVQKEWDEGRWSLLGGLYPIDSEFQVIDSGAIFVQPPYGPTAELSLTRGPSIFNTSALGLRARWTAENQAVYVQGAVLDGIPGDPNRPKGTHITLGKNDGTMSIVELGYRAPAPEAGKEGGGAAKYAIGFWGYSEKEDDLVDVDTSGSPVKQRSQGAYALADRRLWQGRDGFELNGFVRYSVTDGDSTPLENTLSVGFLIKAPFAGRPDDSFGVAFTRGTTGAKYQAQQRAAGTPASADEAAVEVTYRLAATPWLFVQPVFQRYRNPGASTTVDQATVAGARIEVAF